MNIGNIVDSVTKTLDSAKIPANVLPPLLLKCTALTRPGMSAYKLAANIIQNNAMLGIPTEETPDGSENKINQFVYNIAKCTVDMLKNDASIQVSIPMSSLLIETNGANAGGAVTCIGTNLLDSVGNGIIS